MDVTIKVLDPRHGSEWKLPRYSTTGSAGIDLRACIDKPITLRPGQVELIPTGIAVAIPNEEAMAIVVPRSGLGYKHGIVMANLVGIIDSDYRGQVFIALWYRENPVVVNKGKNNFGNLDLSVNDNTFTIEPGDRIAQLIFTPIIKIVPKFTTVDLPSTDRDAGGFGHTGKG